MIDVNEWLLVGAWLFIGYSGAMLARYFFEYGTCFGLSYVKPEPMRRYHLVIFGLASFCGPVVWIMTLTWGVMYVGSYVKYETTNPIGRFFAQPVFKQKVKP